MKVKGHAVSLTVMIVLLAGIHLAATPAAAVTRINTSIAGDLVNIDPAHLSIGPDRMIAHQVLEGLVEFDCGIHHLAHVYPAVGIDILFEQVTYFHGSCGFLTVPDITVAIIGFISSSWIPSTETGLFTVFNLYYLIFI